MELRQLRYFIKVVEQGGMGRAAAELDLATSALSQQISRLESELSTRLLVRTSTGVVPTDAGLAFLHQAQLAIRHADNAMQAARQSRLKGHVSVGFASTTASILSVPFMRAMQERYPQVRVHLVEGLSGNLTSMLNARQLDIAILFRPETALRRSTLPLLNERLFLIAEPNLLDFSHDKPVRLGTLQDVKFILPSPRHELRALLDGAFARANIQPEIPIEVDGLSMLMDLVQQGFGATIQPGAALVRPGPKPVSAWLIQDRFLQRPNLLLSLAEDELSPAALAARVLLKQTTMNLIKNGEWPGASLQKL